MKKILNILIIILIFLVGSNFSYGSEVNIVKPQINKKNISKIDAKNVNDLFSGAGVYSINLDFPKGPLNIKPYLNLSYNSYSTDAFTPYGYGWNLNTQKISRNPKKGIAGVYERNEFSVNGEDLILIEKNLYKSKNINNLNKYYFEKDFWKVIDSKGNTFYYGEKNESRLSDGKNKIYAWYLEKQIDIRGNEIKQIYFKDKNQVYLNEIEYAGGMYKIKFEYIDKKRSLSSYRTQFEVKTSKLLKNIVFYYSDEEIKRYELFYDDKDSVFSHLINFEEKSGSIIKSRYSFEYGKAKDHHLLKKINTNGGVEINFEYKPSVFYTDDFGNKANPKLPFNQKTLHKISYRDKVTDKKIDEKFKYYDGSYYYDNKDIFKRQYAGFGKVEKTDSLGKKEIYYFHQGKNSKDNSEIGEYKDHISKKSKLYRKEIYDENGDIRNIEISKWDTKLDGERYLVTKKQDTKVLKFEDRIDANAIEYEYDQYGNIVKQINHGEVKKIDNKGSFEDIKNDRITTKFSYSQNNDKNLFGYLYKKEVFDYSDKLSNKTEYIYDNLPEQNVEYGNVTNTRFYLSENNFLENKNIYDANGLLVETVNPKGYSTKYFYDNHGIYPIKKVNPKGFIEEFEYDYRNGKQKKHIGFNGLENSKSYDVFGRVLNEKIIYGGEKNEKSENDGVESEKPHPNPLLKGEGVGRKEYKLKEFVYDDVSVPNKILETTYLDKSGENKQENHIYLNGYGDVLVSKKSYQDKYITHKFEYDARGNKTYIGFPTFENDSSYSLLDKDIEFGNKYEYDSQNRVIKISNKSGDIKYLYRNLEFVIQNQKGVKSLYAYDFFGNLVKVVENYSDISGSDKNIETKYKYSVLGKLTEILDAVGNVRNIEYDLIGRRVAIEDLHKIGDDSFGKRLYKYDKNSNLSEYISLSGDVVSYEYDEIDRLKTESVKHFSENNFNKEVGGVGRDFSINYFYDQGVNSKGFLTSYEKLDYKEVFSYDVLGNLIIDKKVYGNDEYINEYQYNLLGQKTKHVFPDNKVIEVEYEYGVPKSLVYDSKEIVKSASYNPAGKLNEVVYGNTAVSKNFYDYEFGYRLYKKGLVFNGKDYGLTNYSFDSVGNITSIKEDGNIDELKKDVSYHYDELSRLMSAKYLDESIDYEYDNIGNIISNSRFGEYTYHDRGFNNPHAVSRVNNEEFFYDNNGNVVSDDFGVYLYNAKDELVASHNNSGRLAYYSHNSSGIRVEKVNSIQGFRYVNKDYELVYDIDESVGSGSSSSGSIDSNGLNVASSSKYIFFGDKKVLSVESLGDEESFVYHHEDHLGGASIDIDEQGNLMQIVDYFPYGDVKNKVNFSLYNNKYLFGGKELDGENDLQYFEARYYDSDKGRFRSIDRVFWEVGNSKRGYNSLYNPQLLNAYSYVGNNPLKYIDPTGLWLESSDATNQFQNYIDRGRSLNYTFKLPYNGGIYTLSGKVGTLPFKTFTNTLPVYLHKTAPHGEYDIKRNNDFKVIGNDKTNQLLLINGEEYLTSELGNFLVGLNGYRAGLKLEEINNYGMSVEALKLEQGNGNFGEEFKDQSYYKGGYIYGYLESTGNYTSEQLEKIRDYLLKKAKNEYNNE